MNIKTFKFNKFYMIFFGLFAIVDFYIAYSICFLKLVNIFMACFISIAFIISLFFRFTLTDDYFEEKIIIKRRFQLSQIDQVVYKRFFQDRECVIYLKNGRKHKLWFNFNTGDAEYFFEYLEKNGIEVIKRH